MLPKRLILLSMVVTMAVLITMTVAPQVSLATPPDSATVQFGREDVGCNKPGGHPCDHAGNRMVPGAVVIAAGGTVHFDMTSFHRIAIYEPGIGPKDIDVDMTVDLTSPIPFPDIVIDDPTGRVTVSSPDPSVLFPFSTTFEPTFTEPGRYLIICTTLPHFVDDNMYGWVIVK